MRVVAAISCGPVPKGRPRFGGGRARTPDETARAEREQAALLASFTPRTPFAGHVRVRLIYLYEPPASWSVTRRAAAVAGGEWPDAADVDNLAKLTLDVLTRLRWWSDDKKVASLVAEKVYGTPAGVRVIVEDMRG